MESHHASLHIIYRCVFSAFIFVLHESEYKQPIVILFYCIYSNIDTVCNWHAYTSRLSYTLYVRELDTVLALRNFPF